MHALKTYANIGNLVRDIEDYIAYLSRHSIHRKTSRDRYHAISYTCTIGVGPSVSIG